MYESSKYKQLRYFTKGGTVLAVVSEDYFVKKNFNRWFEADVCAEILEDSDFVYVYSKNDSVDRINHLFFLHQRGYGNKYSAFMECKMCGSFTLVGDDVSV